MLQNGYIINLVILKNSNSYVSLDIKAVIVPPQTFVSLNIGFWLHFRIVAIKESFKKTDIKSELRMKVCSGATNERRILLDDL